ncbi:hypothetical protein C1706_04795 [Propioniciclava flava]|uniref:Uncharacterized protein n=1 Tax=Propioniciclava flava TaxID=2072026 RepID=A0A4Q2EHF4_9ACTN|nr:hypothetical protein C1706_04795 [Propioniciclava flava]
MIQCPRHRLMPVRLVDEFHHMQATVGIHGQYVQRDAGRGGDLAADHQQPLPQQRGIAAQQSLQFRSRGGGGGGHRTGFVPVDAPHSLLDVHE